MQALNLWLQSHSSQVHGVALALMGISSAFLYPAARSGEILWVWVLLGLFVIGNIVELVAL